MLWFNIRRGRVRRASRAVARDASAANYAALARAAAGQHEDAIRTCSEALELHPQSGELQRIARGARAEQQRVRTARLRNETLAVSPRAALHRELCELLLEVGDAQGALETAQRWSSQTQDPEATYFAAAAHAEFFFDGRRSQDGMAAFRSAEKCARALPGTSAPCACSSRSPGAAGPWEDARWALARLLELMPGNPLLEARFRRVLANCAHSKPLQRAARRRGADRSVPGRRGGGGRGLRSRVPATDAQAAGVGARGSRGVLPSWQHGSRARRSSRRPTAQRAVREVLQVSRASARRMALGRALEIRVEGSFGALTLMPGSLGASAAWSSHSPRGDARPRCSRSLSGGTCQEGCVMQDVLLELTQLPGRQAGGGHLVGRRPPVRARTSRHHGRRLHRLHPLRPDLARGTAHRSGFARGARRELDRRRDASGQPDRLGGSEALRPRGEPGEPRRSARAGRSRDGHPRAGDVDRPRRAAPRCGRRPKLQKLLRDLGRFDPDQARPRSPSSTPNPAGIRDLPRLVHRRGPRYGRWSTEHARWPAAAAPNLLESSDPERGASFDANGSRPLRWFRSPALRRA